MKKTFLVVYHKQGEHYDDELYTWLVQATDRRDVVHKLQTEKQFRDWTPEQFAHMGKGLSSVHIIEADFTGGDVQFIDKWYLGD